MAITKRRSFVVRRPLLNSLTHDWPRAIRFPKAEAVNSVRVSIRAITRMQKVARVWRGRLAHICNRLSKLPARSDCAHSVPTAKFAQWAADCNLLNVNGRDGRIRTGGPLTPSQV